jgi:hypothetical protein
MKSYQNPIYSPFSNDIFALLLLLIPLNHHEIPNLMKSYLILLTHHEIPCFPVFFHLFPWDLSIFTHGQQDSQPEASLLDGRRALLAFARGKARGTMMPGRSGSGANFSGWI